MANPLTINGYAVPVSAYDAQMGHTVIGTSERAPDGTMRVNRRALKRGSQMRTTPQTLADAQAISRWIIGEGDRWPFDTDLYSGKGLGPIAGYVASLRPGEGKFGAAGVAVEAATTNLIASGSAGSLTFGGSWTYPGGATVTLTQGLTLTANGATVTTAATRVQTSGGTSTTKLRYSTTAGTAGTPLALGLWIKNQGSGVVQLFNSFGDAVSINAGTTTWATVARSSVDGVTVRNMDIRAANVGDSLDLVLYAPQMEVQYTATTYTASSRSGAGVLGYRLGSTWNWDEFTVAFWAVAGNDPTYRMFCGSAPDWYFGTNNNLNNNVALFWVDSNGVTQSLASGTVSGLTANTGYNHYAVTYHRGTTTAKIYTGGVLRATSTSAVLNTTYSGTFGIGTTGGDSTSLPLNGKVDALTLAPYQMNDGQIAALAARTAAIPALPFVEASGDLLRGALVTVLGEVQDGAVEQYGDGLQRRVVPFTLAEQ